MTDRKTVHVISATDNNYIQHLAVAFASLLAHLSREWTAKLYVIEGGLTKDNRERLTRTVERHRGELEFIAVRPEDYDNLALGTSLTHITAAAFYRINIPEVFRRDGVRRVIYLDCDLLVLDDISELWMTELQGRPLGAVRDLGGVHRLEDLSIPRAHQYFNSGVLLIDLDQWRERSLSRKVLQFAIDHPEKLHYHDQDALNAVLHAEWQSIDPKWNLQTNMLLKPSALEGGADAVKRAAIVHFTGSSKPWQFDNAHKYKRHYYKYLSLTDWNGYKPPKGVKLVLKRFAKFVLPPFAILLLNEALEWF